MITYTFLVVTNEELIGEKLDVEFDRTKTNRRLY